MTRDREAWLTCIAAALGVAITECKKDEGTHEAHAVPTASTFTIPPPHDTVCSVSVKEPDAGSPPPFTLAFGGDQGAGACWEPSPPPNPHPNPICGAVARREEACSTRKPPTPNLRATVRSTRLARAQLEAPLRAAFEQVLKCATGAATGHVTLEVDAAGKVTARSSGTGFIRATPCVVAAFGAVTLPPGPDTITIDLTST